LDAALTAAALAHHSLDDTGDSNQPAMFRVDADAETVGRVAWSAGVALTELRAADGAGLEEMFLALTAETQRDRRPVAQPALEGAVA
jgi:ABC-2 type transport system ATP-binding protein